MKGKWHIAIPIGILALGLAACGQGTTAGRAAEDAEAVGAIQATLDDEENAPLFETEIFVEEMDGISPSAPELEADASGDAQTAFKHSDPEHPMLPRWFRRITERDREVDIHIEDGKAEASVSVRLQGDLFLDIDGDTIFGTKPIDSTARRSAKFERVRPRHWRLTAITPVEYSLTDPEAQTVYLRRIKATVGDEVRWEVDDPAAFYEFPTGLPIFAPDEEVVVTAVVENLDGNGLERPSVVYLHHDGRREPMFDDGLHGGDETAGDGVFTKTKRIGPRLGIHHAAVDALDAEVFADETTPNYNASAWGMPYLVTAAFAGQMHQSGIEGGCWIFTTQDGKSFRPRGGAPELYQDGLRATIYGYPRPLLTDCQVGPVLRVLRFEIHPGQGLN